MQMRLPFVAGAIGLAVSAMLPAHAAVPGRVSDLPAEVAITDLTVLASGTVTGVAPDTRSLTLPTPSSDPYWMYQQEEVRPTNYPDPWNYARAIAWSSAMGQLSTDVRGAFESGPQQASALASWSATLTNTGSQARSFYGSLILENELGTVSSCCSGAATFKVGASTYELHDTSSSQSFSDFTLAPGQSVQLSLSLNSLESGLAGESGHAEYAARFVIGTSVVAVPEPSTVLLQAVGLAALLAVARRRAGTRRG